MIWCLFFGHKRAFLQNTYVILEAEKIDSFRTKLHGSAFAVYFCERCRSIFY